MGRFIIIEGIDGSGKSSILSALSANFEKDDVIFTEEPTKSWLGDVVRRSHIERVSPFTEAFLFLADRAAHTEAIRAWLSEGKTVICDRYYHSTVAYQGAALEDKVDFDRLLWLLEINRKISLEPNLIFFLEVDPSTALRRINVRGGQSKFEQEEFLAKVAKNYARLAQLCENVTVIDASRSLDKVLEDIVGRL